MADIQKIVITPNAFDNGFLNKTVAQQFADLVVRPWEVKTKAPLGACKVIQSMENIVLDLTTLMPPQSFLTQQMWVSGTLRTANVFGTLNPIP